MHSRENEGELLECYQQQVELQLAEGVRCWVLDIDENLFSVSMPEASGHRLSKSAEIELSTSDEGKIISPEIFRGYFVKEVRAHARRKWQELFEKLVMLNDRYRSLNGNVNAPLLFHFMFLTHASYEADLFIKNVFEKVYSQNLTEFMRPYFYNIENQENLIGFANKGKFMDVKFHREWQTKFEIPNKHQFRLIDDNIGNINSACNEGFSTLHNPTSVGTRDANHSYSAEKDNIFATLHQDLDRASVICDLLEKISNLKGVSSGSARSFVEIENDVNNMPVPFDPGPLGSYDTDSEDESTRRSTPAASHSSMSSSGSRFFSAHTPDIFDDNVLEKNLIMILLIIRDYEDELKAEANMPECRTRSGYCFLNRIADLLKNSFTDNYQTKMGVDYFDLADDIKYIAQIYQPFDEANSPYSAYVANQLRTVITAESFTRQISSTLLETIDTRQIDARQANDRLNERLVFNLR